MSNNHQKTDSNQSIDKYVKATLVYGLNVGEGDYVTNELGGKLRSFLGEIGYKMKQVRVEEYGEDNEYDDDEKMLPCIVEDHYTYHIAYAGTEATIAMKATYMHDDPRGFDILTSYDIRLDIVSTNNLDSIIQTITDKFPAIKRFEPERH